MSWLSAVVTAALTLLVFWLPGLALAKACSVRGMLARGAVAPVLTLTIAGVGAILCGELGVRWGPVPFIASTVIAVGVATGARGLRRPRPASRLGWSRALRSARLSISEGRQVLAATATGVLIPVTAIMIGIGRPDRILAGHDIIGHFNAIRFVQDTGRGSSLDLSAVNSATWTASGFDGAAWHDVVAVIPPWPGPAQVFSMSAFVPTAAAWTVGLVFLTSIVLPARRRAWSWAALASCAGIAMPSYLTLIDNGLLPNSVAVALVPAVVAWWVRTMRSRRPSDAVVGTLLTVGLGLTHPNAVFSVMVILGPWCVIRLIRWLSTDDGPPVRRVLIAAMLGSLPIVGALFVTAPRIAAVVRHASDPPLPAVDLVARVFSGNAITFGWSSGTLIALAGFLGLVIARRLPHARPVAVGALAILTFFLAAASPIPYVTDVDRLWYGEPMRFATPMVAMLVPFAALALDSLPGWIRTHGRTHAFRRRRPPHLRATLVTAVLALGALPAATGLALGTAHAYRPTDRAPLVTDDELALIGRIADRVTGDGTVLGSPFAGTAALYALHGIPTLPRTAFTEHTSDMLYVARHLADLGTDDAICGPLRRLDARYLYVDPTPWTTSQGVLDIREPPPLGVRLIDAAGQVGVYEIMACDDEL